MLSTQNMGGVEVTAKQLKEMQADDYILHARNGKLQKVPVEKIRLPLDAQGHVQRLGLILTPNGTIYASQYTLISKSTDAGKTWEHLQRDPSPFGGWLLQVDEDGRRLLNLSQSRASGKSPTIWASEDDGATWESIGKIDVTPLENVEAGWSMTRLKDGILLIPILNRAAQISADYGTVISGGNTTYVFRSEDGGYTFPYRSLLGDWCHEVNIAALPYPRLLAVIRYQRPLLPEDPADILERTGAAVLGSKFPYKHVFLADSPDGGVTWDNLRQLTTVFGQCHGAAVGLSDNRVVVVHDHRYPRELSSGRAMVSYDSGQNWADEVYYLCHGNAAGFAQTITLDGEEMLTLVGSAYGNVDSWDNCIGKSHFVLIRWRLV
jgi:hypothetical protein